MSANDGLAPLTCRPRHVRAALAALTYACLFAHALLCGCGRSRSSYRRWSWWRGCGRRRRRRWWYGAQSCWCPGCWCDDATCCSLRGYPWLAVALGYCAGCVWCLSTQPPPPPRLHSWSSRPTFELPHLSLCVSFSEGRPPGSVMPARGSSKGSRSTSTDSAVDTRSVRHQTTVANRDRLEIWDYIEETARDL